MEKSHFQWTIFWGAGQTGFTDNGAPMGTLVIRGFVFLGPDAGGSAAWQLGDL